MLVRSPHHRPKQQNRNGEDQRLEDNPAKAKTVATKPRINFAYQKSADDAPLRSKILPEITHNPKRMLGGGMLTNVRDEQPSKSVNEQAGGDNGDERDDPLREKRVVGKVRLGNRFEIELLSLRLDTGRLQ